MDASLANLSFAAFLVAHLFAVIAVPKIKFMDDHPPHGCDAGVRPLARCCGKRRPFRIPHRIVSSLKIAALVFKPPFISATKRV